MNFSGFGKLFVSNLLAELNPMTNKTPDATTKKPRGRPRKVKKEDAPITTPKPTEQAPK